MLIDGLARTMARATTRRGALQFGVPAALASLVGLHAAEASAESSTPVAGEPTDFDPVFMFVQSATSGSIVAADELGTPETSSTGDHDPGRVQYHLTLHGHNGQTIYFSDRPYRITGTASTESILEALGFTPVNPPNAALVTSDESGHSTIMVVELIDAAFDRDSNSLVHRAILLEDFTEFEVSSLEDLTMNYETENSSRDFRDASLFIDDCPDIEGCWSRISPNETRFIGPVPGFPNGIGRCFHVVPLGCWPCGTDDPKGQKAAYDQMCLDEYYRGSGFYPTWAG